ncbi:hypothetical protein A3A75_01675 [Candidatus Woesebacteria bacterium RIFCSPLOWO2_01_FULL_39_10]|uniref:Glycosyltransferase RgtA/B/C/D-like domain-containing protein n=1 Tax=Candidatus Woesebacteria bacterium RIFCSPLOWO2_01_FULL_39_10 TaxID=1802516 RepID=A0A1F8B7T4_9BACT|nr:MAG: hypothetical protein A3A75_01675 [Candidatus Woesebacteria bacterium RIFCSPLOWO2_01_FULL_39_10]
MYKNLSSLLKKFWEKEIKQNPLVYLILAAVLTLALYVRVYRTQDLLRFYFDQGRDALVIWQLWHEGKPFLIGPVTGLAGLFLGPFYYYLIAPFYLIDGGSPVYPAIFLAFLATAGIAVTYYIGWQMQSRITGLIAAIIASFSYYMVLAGRWLANPTPIFLTSALLLLAMWRLVNKKENRKKMASGSESLRLGEWLTVALMVGISLHFEAASAVFYIPMVVVFYIYLYLTNKKALPNRSVILTSGLIFFATLLPQVVFNLRHENILFNNFKKVIFEEQSYGSPFTSYNWDKKRQFFWDVFTSKVFPSSAVNKGLYYFASLAGLILAFRKIPKAISLLVIFIGIPMIGYFFFQGNYGNIYDYYMTGYYLPMILLFSLGLGLLWKNLIGRIIVITFLIVFLRMNWPLVGNLIAAGVDGPTHITLGNQLQAVNWVFEDASALKEFNVDVYVPPVIPHAYDYLFLWQASKRCGRNLCGMVKEPQKEIVYVLYEVDPPHPERLENWIARYRGNTQVEREERFGGITIQRRRRS